MDDQSGGMDWEPQDSATPALVQAWRRLQAARGVAAGESLAVAVSESMTVSEQGSSLATPGTGHVNLQGQPPGVTVTAPPAALVSDLVLRWQALPDVLIQAAIVTVGDRTDEGALVTGVSLPWFEIIRELERDPDFLFKIPWRKLEELIAGAFERDGYQVTLTPPSGDHGRDVIAERTGVGCIRIVDQVKAYKPSRLVKADEVRAMCGVLATELNVSKGMVMTTSGFAPRIADDPRLRALMPHRLELLDGKELLHWLVGLLRNQRGSEGGS